MTFNQPLPIPENAIVLSQSEKAKLRKYLERLEKANREANQAHEALNDIAMSIALRAGGTATEYAISADLGCLIPKNDSKTTTTVVE